MANVTCGLTANKPGSALCPTLVIEYWTTTTVTSTILWNKSSCLSMKWNVAISRNKLQGRGTSTHPSSSMSSSCCLSPKWNLGYAPVWTMTKHTPIWLQTHWTSHGQWLLDASVWDIQHMQNSMLQHCAESHSIIAAIHMTNYNNF